MLCSEAPQATYARLLHCIPTSSSSVHVFIHYLTVVTTLLHTLCGHTIYYTLLKVLHLDVWMILNHKCCGRVCVMNNTLKIFFDRQWRCDQTYEFLEGFRGEVWLESSAGICSIPALHIKQKSRTGVKFWANALDDDVCNLDASCPWLLMLHVIKFGRST